MSELTQILLTSGLTVFGGLIVFVLGQWILKLVLEPIRDLRKTMGEVRYSIAFHAQILITPISRTEDRSEEARRDLVRLSCELYIRSEAIPWSSCLSELSNGFVPEDKNIRSAAIALRSLSTYVKETGEDATNHSDEVKATIKKIENALDLPPLEES